MADLEEKGSLPVSELLRNLFKIFLPFVWNIVKVTPNKVDDSIVMFIAELLGINLE
jgi:hypothetical protein|tara:strand:- start:856 stop:1023 length:168 start_codon:yes stop_codon:yes gene_type:complete